ncbi:MAG: InlB B-repeat-containing protein [Bacilli bacterium]|nr:InlB B-repeat-containing protein [Bacilli bacterium]
MAIIDSRLKDCDTDQDVTENFNRVLSLLDTINEVVADLEDSQLFKVVFDSDGGSSVATQYVIEGEKATEPADPTKEDYTFDGWYNGEVEYDFTKPVKEHLSLKATWTADE